MKNNIFKLAFNILIPLLLSFLVFLATKNDISYLETLNRKIVLPNIVYPIVWSVLYVLMGIWIYFYEKNHPDDKKTIVVYWISVFVNLMFSFILFSFHQILLAFFDVIVLLIMIGYLFIKNLLQKEKYAYLLLPYIVWLCLATSLMVDLIVHN
ncbi:tspO/MBR family protein [Firmicutes bacterium CAG:449]|nr:tspO/MBR family protein [Firmicutes bacterium CAG:449]